MVKILATENSRFLFFEEGKKVKKPEINFLVLLKLLNLQT